jgi:MoaD family protein
MARVRLFAVLREIAGTAHTEAAGTTVRSVAEELTGRYGERFGQVVSRSTFAIDGERAGLDDPVTDADEVAILPPVSGG